MNRNIIPLVGMEVTEDKSSIKYTIIKIKDSKREKILIKKGSVIKEAYKLKGGWWTVEGNKIILDKEHVYY